ncbi:TolC family protein [Clostridium sp. YIM B02555]|uniref:TolC family protein n=1 Tax=Clostridium sp. YIM B02555 TaxID=2911968 RepID=UPI001EEE73B1|nr:TolC family protein [Clostridium sp. YIM B02555]
MRKNINKLVAFAIGISIMSGSIMPVFAADTTKQDSNTVTSTQTISGKPLFTLDEAIKVAISNSDTLAIDDKKVSYQDKVNDVNERIDDATSVSGDKEDYNKDTRDNSLNQAEQKREFDEDAVIQKTTTAYNNIVTSQMKIDKAAKDLEVRTKQLNDLQLKKNLGIVTEVDLQNSQLNIQNLQYTQKFNENTLKDAIYSFKVLTGKDVTKYSLEQDIQFDKLKIDGDIDEYFDDVIDKDLKYQIEANKIDKEYYNDHDNQVSEQMVRDAKDKTDNAGAPPTSTLGEPIETYMNDYNIYTAKKSAYSNALSARLQYLGKKLSMDTTDISLNMTKKQLKDTLRNLYTNLLKTEDSITYLKSNIELTNKQISNAKLKYDLGMMTKSDYDALVVNSLDLNIQLRTAIDGYNTLKDEIQKPWTLSSGSK